MRRRLVPAAIVLAACSIAGLLPQAVSAVTAAPGCAVPAKGQSILRPGLAEAVVDRVNAQRRKHGMPALARSAALERSARWKAWHMATVGYFAHDDPLGQRQRTFSARISSCGYDWSRAAENIAWGQGTAAAAVRDWLASPGHRANMLDPALAETGVGVAWSRRGLVWVQEFGTPAR
ncbi:MAG: CAP domain-containing protein [Thermoleophilia bacterium]